MNLDHFMNLTDDERSAYLQSCEALETTVKDQEAEISSLKNENDNYKAGAEKLEKDLKEAKELNFTLARSVNPQPKQSAEDILQDMFYPKKGE